MTPCPCREAIAIYNHAPPADWAERMPRARRRALLREKMLALCSWPRADWLRVIPKPGLELSRPYPAAPEVLNRPFTGDVRKVLTAYASSKFEAARIGAFVEDARPGHRFASDWQGGRWRMIRPPLTGTLRDLAGAAHELGHLLAGEPAAAQLADLIRGEAMALTLEAQVLADQLEGAARAEWIDHCHLSDLYNFEFMHHEFADDPEALIHPAFIFRETLWTAHGYQAVYAAASLVRQKTLKELYDYRSILAAG